MIINSGTSHSLVLSGNIHDLFFVRDGDDTDYIPLVPFLTRSWDIPGFILNSLRTQWTHPIFKRG